MNSSGQGQGRHDEYSDSVAQDAARSTIAVNPITSISSRDLLGAAKAVLAKAVRDPVSVASRGVQFGGDLARIAVGFSDYDPPSRDRRFRDKAWHSNPWFRRVLQAYLAAWHRSEELLNDLGLDGLDESRARFFLGAFLESMSPTNTILGNPEALRKIVDTGGESLVRGLKNAVRDLKDNGGMPSQVDKSQFKVGQNLATTPGSVVFRNEILELIQYSPNTSEVREIPLLVVPPQINKYYVFDLAPEKSFFAYCVSKGIRLFAISWRNPGPENSGWGLDAYVTAMKEAVAAIQAITDVSNVNLMGACSGGITASILTGHLSAKQDSSINSLTLSVCMLSQERADTEMTMFATKPGIELARERSRRKGVLDGRSLSRMFNWMRPNDLIWNYVVNNYLLGNDPPAVDILYWNHDTTCLPAQLHSDFLDQFLTNPLPKSGALTDCGTPIDLQMSKCDKFIVAGQSDHITPWQACYRSTEFLGGEIKFVLSTSGHIQSLINPPGNPKSRFFTNKHLPSDAVEWLEAAEESKGTWWDHWIEWLQSRSGNSIQANELPGSRQFQPICDAPGEYVHG